MLATSVSLPARSIGWSRSDASRYIRSADSGEIDVDCRSTTDGLFIRQRAGNLPYFSLLRGKKPVVRLKAERSGVQAIYSHVIWR